MSDNEKINRLLTVAESVTLYSASLAAIARANDLATASTRLAERLVDKLEDAAPRGARDVADEQPDMSYYDDLGVRASLLYTIAWQVAQIWIAAELEPERSARIAPRMDELVEELKRLSAVGRVDEPK